MMTDMTICIETEDDVYEAEVQVSSYYEPDYGADSDGNRGMPRYCIDDIKIINVVNSDGELVDLTTVEDLEYMIIAQATDKFYE